MEKTFIFGWIIGCRGPQWSGYKFFYLFTKILSPLLRILFMMTPGSSPLFFLSSPNIAAEMKQLVIPKFDSKDQFLWMDTNSGALSFKEAFSHVRPPQPGAPWSKLIWHSSILPSKSFIAWRLFHNRMPIDEKLWKAGCTVVSVCSLCYQAEETSLHLLFNCPFA